MKKYFYTIAALLFILLSFLSTQGWSQANQVFKIPMRSGPVELESGSFDTSEGRYLIVQFDKKMNPSTMKQLRGFGINLLSFLYKDAWLCSADPFSFTEELKKKFGIVAVAPWRPEYKISPHLRNGEFSQWAVTESGKIKLLVTFFPDASPGEIKSLLAQYDPSYAASQEPNTWAIQIAPERIEDLIRAVIVHSVEEGPGPIQPLNDKARLSLFVDPVQNVDLTSTPPVYHGLSGRGVNIAVYDAGFVYTEHPDFWDHDSSGNPTTSRFLNTGYYGGYRDLHATHVAGIIGGNGWNSASYRGSPYQWRGMAPEATLINYGYGIYPIDASNHSYLMEHSSYGSYGSNSRSVDRDIRGGEGPLYQKPHIWAAANQGFTNEYGPDIGYYSIYAPAKNAICVGEANANDGTLYHHSSLGPTFDGRIKPDVMGPGCNNTLPRNFDYYNGFINVEIDYIHILDGSNTIIKGWDFQSPYNREGWFNTEAHDIYDVNVSGGLLSFETKLGGGGSVENINVQAESHQKIEMRYRMAAPGSPPFSLKAMFYWKVFDVSGGSGKYDRNIAFDVTIDGRFHVATIPVGQFGAKGDDDWSITGLNGWEKTIEGLMISPAVGSHGIKSTSNASKGIYVEGCGTSMAAPAITGTVALMLEQFVKAGKFVSDRWEAVNLDANPPLPSTIKAILIQTATDMIHTRADPRDPDNPDTGSPVLYYEGPDFATGYGLVNAQRAVNLIADASRKPLIQESSLEDHAHLYEIRLSSSIPELKVTLAWDDVEGSTVLDQRVPRLVNDLDLVLIDPDGNRHYPWTLDPFLIAECRKDGSCADLDPIKPEDVKAAYKGPDHRNNVEQVQVKAPRLGTWKVMVMGYNIHDVSDGPQTYSLVSQVPLKFKGEVIESLTHGAPKGNFGLGRQSDEVTEPDHWRQAERYYGFIGIDEIKGVRDLCGQRNIYVIGKHQNDLVEYLMKFGEDYSRLTLRGLADIPAPVQVEIYIDGQSKTTAWFEENSNCSEDIHVDIRGIQYDTHTIAVKFVNDFSSPTLDRDFYLNGLRVTRTPPSEMIPSLTGGKPKGTFGAGRQSDEATDVGHWRPAEYFYGFTGVDEIKQMQDACGRRNTYVVLGQTNDLVEYMMKFGGSYDRLILRVLDTPPKGVRAEIYIDGKYMAEKWWYAGDGLIHDVEVEISEIPYGTHAIAVKFNDYYQNSGLGDERNLYLSGLLVSRVGIKTINSYSGWKSFDREVSDWEKPGFDDSGWRDAYRPYPYLNSYPPTYWICWTQSEFMWDWDYTSGGIPNGQNGPVNAWFRHTFYLPVGSSQIATAQVVLGADDDFDFYVNGTLVFSDRNGKVWGAPYTVDVKPFLVEGDNVFAIHARDTYGGYEWLLFDATIE